MRAFATDPSPIAKAHFGKGFRLFLEGKYTEAANSFDDATDQSHSAPFFYYAAIARASAGAKKEATKDLRDALRLDRAEALGDHPEMEAFQGINRYLFIELRNYYRMTGTLPASGDTRYGWQDPKKADIWYGWRDPMRQRNVQLSWEQASK